MRADRVRGCQKLAIDPIPTFRFTKRLAPKRVAMKHTVARHERAQAGEVHLAAILDLGAALFPVALCSI
jgi:hypothetical protein